MASPQRPSNPLLEPLDNPLVITDEGVSVAPAGNPLLAADETVPGLEPPANPLLKDTNKPLRGRLKKAGQLVAKLGVEGLRQVSPLGRMMEQAQVPMRASAAALAGQGPKGVLQQLTLDPERTPVGGAEVLEHFGVPEMGHASDLLPQLYNETGEGWKLQRGGAVDPTGRGLAGFAAEIPLDPLTYVGLGQKPIAAVVRSAERTPKALPALTKAGRKAIRQATKEELPEAFRYASKLAETGLDETDALRRAREIQSAADDIALESAVTRISDAAESGVKGLVDDSVLRVAGMPVVSRKGIGKLVDSLPFAEKVANATGRLTAPIDKAFNETLAAGRRIPGMLEAKDTWRAQRRLGVTAADRDVAKLTPWAKRKFAPEVQAEVDKIWPDVLGPAPQRLGEYALLHLDDPGRFPLPVALEGRAAVADDIRRIRVMTTEAFEQAVRAQAMDPSAYRQNYAPHQFRNHPDDLRDLSLKWTDQAGRAFDAKWNTGAYNESRVFPTLTDAASFARRLKDEGLIKWDLKPDLNIQRVLSRRMRAHAETMAARRFEQRLIAEMGLGADEVDLQVFKLVGPEASARLQQEMAGLSGKPSTVTKGLSPRAAQGLARRYRAAVQNALAGKSTRRIPLRSMTATGAAVYRMARLAGVKNMDDFKRLLDRYSDEIGHVSPTVMEDIRNSLGTGYRKTLAAFGEPYKQVESGPFAGYWLPQAAADEMSRMGSQLINQKEVGKLLQVWDTVNDLHKFSVTIPWPGFTTRNLRSDVAQAGLEAGLAIANPARLMRLAGIGMGRDGTVKGLRNYTFEEIRQMFSRYGLETQKGFLHDFASSGRGRSIMSDNVASRFFRKLYRTEELSDGVKLNLFVTHIENGLHPEEAARRVHKTLFDYQELSPTERGVFRRLFPLNYVWASKNIRAMADHLVRRPGRISALLRIGEADTGPDPEALPEYLRGDFKLRLDNNREGTRTYITGLDLPIDAAIETAMGTSGRNAFRQNMASLAPALKFVAEWGTQRELFNDRDIREAQPLRGLAQDVVSKLPPATQRWLEYDPETQTMDGAKAYLLFKSYALSRVFTTAQAITDDDKATAVQVLLGLGIKEFDLNDMERKKALDTLHRWEEELLRKGKYQRIIVPRSTPEPAAPTNPLLQ